MFLAPIRGKTIDTSEIKYLIVQNDSSIDTIKFQLKKMYEEKDLSQYAFVLMYANSEGEGEAVSLTKTVEDDLLYLTFTPGRPFTDVSGKMTIIIQGIKSASEKWQSMPANINIENNVSPDPIRPLDPSLIQQLIDNIQNIEDDFEEVQGMLDQASDIIEGADDIRTMLNNFTTELETLQTTINNKYTLPSGGIPKTDLSSSVQASLDKAENAQPKESGKGLSTNDYSNAEKQKVADNTAAKHSHSNKAVLDAIAQSLIDKWNTVDQKATSADLNQVIALIMAGTSESNQLINKEFLNSSIATETAHYISDDGEPFTAVADLPTTGVTNNDYAFVTGTDSAGNTFYDRYKATVPKPSGASSIWSKEFRLNNSSFTAVQWAAINSGITALLVSSISEHLTDNSKHVTSADKASWNEAASKASSALQPTAQTFTEAEKQQIRTNIGAGTPSTSDFFTVKNGKLCVKVKV